MKFNPFFSKFLKIILSKNCNTCLKALTKAQGYEKCEKTLTSINALVGTCKILRKTWGENMSGQQFLVQISQDSVALGWTLELFERYHEHQLEWKLL